MAALKTFKTKEELILAYALHLHEVQLSCGGMYAKDASVLEKGQEVRIDERLGEYRISAIRTVIKSAARRIFFKTEFFKEDNDGAYGWVARGFGFCPTGDWQDKENNLELLTNKGIEIVENNKEQTSQKKESIIDLKTTEADCMRIYQAEQAELRGQKAWARFLETFGDKKYTEAYERALEAASPAKRREYESLPHIKKIIAFARAYNLHS